MKVWLIFVHTNELVYTQAKLAPPKIRKINCLHVLSANHRVRPAGDAWNWLAFHCSLDNPFLPLYHDRFRDTSQALAQLRIHFTMSIVCSYSELHRELSTAPTLIYYCTDCLWLSDCLGSTGFDKKKKKKSKKSKSSAALSPSSVSGGLGVIIHHARPQSRLQLHTSTL